MTPRNVLSTLNSYLDTDTAVATDVGQHRNNTPHIYGIAPKKNPAKPYL